jgi:DHA3 family macrolide efflux protein-like MFS transporter
MTLISRSPSTQRVFTFYALLLSQTLSLIGSRMTSIALGLWVFAATGQTTPLLLTAFFNELPGMLGGGLAGVLVDRWNRKTIMLLADLGQALGSLLLFVSFVSGAFQLWHLYTVALIQGIFATLQGPAERATVTLLIPDEHRERANGIMQLAFPLASILAPVLTGLIYAGVGVTGVIAVDLATFVVAALVVLALTIPRPAASAEGQAGQGHLLGELRGGLRFLRQRPPLLLFLLYLTFINFLLNGPLDLNIPYLFALTGSEAQVGFGLGAASAGALAGAALITVIGRVRPRLRLMLAGALLTGLMFLVLGLARTLPLVSVALFLLILPLPANGALFISFLQVKTPPDLQGRVFALESQLALLGSTVSFLLIGPLVDRVIQPLVGTPAWLRVAPLVGSGPEAGIGLLLVVTGVLYLAASLLVFSLPSVRHMEAALPDYQTK